MEKTGAFLPHQCKKCGSEKTTKDLKTGLNYCKDCKKIS